MCWVSKASGLIITYAQLWTCNFLLILPNSSQFHTIPHFSALFRAIQEQLRAIQHSCAVFRATEFRLETHSHVVPFVKQKQLYA